MSYILDALKKSEKERRRGTLSDLLTIQEVTIKKEKKHHIWQYLLIFALILNAGVLVWWLGYRETDKKNIFEQQNISKETRQYQPKPLNSKIVNSESKTSASKEIVSSSIERKESGDDIAQKKQISLSTQNSSQKNSEKIIVPNRNKIYNLNELPSSIQEVLPPLKITISLYSDDPALRMVKIGDKMLHEGEYLSDGLKLDSITTEDVIFSYKGFRFRAGPR